jgi:REP element-mobilizing transposase RayT
MSTNMPSQSDPWNLPPPPGFQGLREDLPLKVYWRHLPHWRQDGATYFVTYRLADSLPREQLDYLRRLRGEWERRNPPPRSDQAWDALTRDLMQRIEDWLDLGSGSCCLRDPRAADLLVGAFHHFDTLDQADLDESNRTPHQVRYELGCYVVMPNHVHAIIRPLQPDVHPLEKILQSWKTYTAREINALFQIRGSLWVQESFDRIIRDEEHLWRTIRYIGNNPAKAKLNPKDCRMWIRPSWSSGWGFA